MNTNSTLLKAFLYWVCPFGALLFVIQSFSLLAGPPEVHVIYVERGHFVPQSKPLVKAAVLHSRTPNAPKKIVARQHVETWQENAMSRHQRINFLLQRLHQPAKIKPNMKKTMGRSRSNARRVTPARKDKGLGARTLLRRADGVSLANTAKLMPKRRRNQPARSAGVSHRPSTPPSGCGHHCGLVNGHCSDCDSMVNELVAAEMTALMEGSAYGEKVNLLVLAQKIYRAHTNLLLFGASTLYLTPEESKLLAQRI
jgi:hypothetical protein